MRVTCVPLYGLLVVTRLGRLVHGRGVLCAEVAGQSARVGLPARLVEDPAHRRAGRLRVPGGALLESRLGRAMEAVPERLLRTIEIRHADVRPGRSPRGPIRVGGWVGVQAGVVHDRPRPTALAVRVTDSLDETHG